MKKMTAKQKEILRSYWAAKGVDIDKYQNMELQIPLRFHTNPISFYESDGTLREEPEESLDELQQTYNQACEAFVKLKEDYDQVMQPYRNPETGEIDYEAIDNDHSENGMKAFQYSLADFNCFNGLDYLQYLIDLKIMHLNARLMQP